MRRLDPRLDGGGGFVSELCLFLMVLGSALLSALAILKHNSKDRGDKDRL